MEQEFDRWLNGQDGFKDLGVLSKKKKIKEVARLAWNAALDAAIDATDALVITERK